MATLHRNIKKNKILSTYRPSRPAIQDNDPFITEILTMLKTRRDFNN